MKKYDKSLIEVWEWKEKVFEEVKNLSIENYVAKIKSDTDRILLENGIKLKRVSFKEEKRRVA